MLNRHKNYWTIVHILARLVRGEKVPREPLMDFAILVKSLYDSHSHQELDLIALKARVSLLENENKFLTGLLQEE